MLKKSDLPFPGEVQRKVRKERVNWQLWLGFRVPFFAQSTSIPRTALLVCEIKSSAVESGTQRVCAAFTFL